MVKQWEDYTPKQKKLYIIVLGICLAVILLVAVGAAIAGGNDEGKAAFSAKVLNTEVVDPATLRVYYEVKNAGTLAGKSDCTINATNSTGQYKGFDVFGSDEVNAGESSTFKGDLTITNEGARFVTDTTIECS